MYIFMSGTLCIFLRRAYGVVLLCSIAVFYQPTHGISVSVVTSVDAPIVTTTDDSSLQGIEGFAATLRCLVNTCVGSRGKVKWFKFSEQLTENTNTFNSRHGVRHTIKFKEPCTTSCATGSSNVCRNNELCRFSDLKCCSCLEEEFTLLIKNLTFTDSGPYRCQLEGGNNFTTRLLVVESGTFASLGQNLSFDHTACCRQKGMSNQCLEICKPNRIETANFDPMPCQKEFGKLLQCATSNGTTSHIHCCRLRYVPGFCWDYCSSRNSNFSQANKMCMYWLPEIFDCFEQAYLPLPGHPTNVIVSQENDTALEVCWETPDLRGDTVRFYTVHYQEMPSLSLFGAGGLFMPRIPVRGDNNNHNRFGPPSTPSSDESPSDDEDKENVPMRRKKRQTLFITTRNLATNQTDVREFRYKTVNTTDTCQMLTDLAPSTQYSIYVTATNNYGMSLPSVKETAITANAVYSNESMPDVMSCCRREGVSSTCAAKMCDLTKPPTGGSAFELAFGCRREFPKVTPCLADNRDHSACCKEKGVFGDCLKFCNGSSENISMASVLCLTFDIQAIFACYRRGYLKLPSVPTNVTVRSILSTAATISWSKPINNPEQVTNYSLFFGTDSYTEIENVQSPYQMLSLVPDTLYSVYVVANAETGSSLKSTVETFRTTQPTTGVCQYGKPLLDGAGSPILCGSAVRCPASYKCIAVRTDVPDSKYCCPVEIFPIGPSLRIQEPNVAKCCLNKGVSHYCARLCSYDTTTRDIQDAGVECAAHVDAFIECGIDGRNNEACCRRTGVSNSCMDFCLPPLKNSVVTYIECLPQTEKILSCAREGVLYRPGKPTAVSVEDHGADWFTIRWSKPKQNVTVKQYELLINNISMSNTTGLSLTVSGLRTNKVYALKIRAWNNRGSSMASDPINLSLTADSRSPSDDYKPRVPFSVSKVWFKDGSANITWKWRNTSVNGKPIGKVQFTVSYIDHPLAFRSDIGADKWKTITTDTMFVVLHNLTYNNNYDIRIKALNQEKHVESLPSEINVIKAIEVDETARIEMWTDPTGYIEAGNVVDIHCVAKGTIANRTMFMRKGIKNILSGAGHLNLTFKAIRPEDGLDPFMCVVNNAGQIVQSRLFVKIRFAPVMDDTLPSPKSLKVLEDSAVILSCRFRGFPPPNVDWFFKSDDSRNKQPSRMIRNDRNHDMAMSFDQEKPSIFENKLMIARISALDSGTYTCKACNEVGCANRTIQLSVDTVSAPSGPEEILGCCDKKIKSSCRSICNDDDARDQFDEDDQCAVEFYRFFQCSSVSLNAQSCCRRRAIPSSCYSFCTTGSILNEDVTQMPNYKQCKTYESLIVPCLHQAYKLAYPETYRLNNFSSIGGRKVNVSWNLPEEMDEKGNDHQNIYILYYKASDDKNFTTMKTRNKYVILSLKPAMEYTFTILAKNRHGFSSFSPQNTYMYQPLSMEESSSGLGAGAVTLIIFLLLLVTAVALSALYFTRKPHKMPRPLIKIFKRNHPAANGAVAFENPGYSNDRDGQVHGLPGDPIIPSTNLSARGANVGFSNAAYESADLQVALPSTDEFTSKSASADRGHFEATAPAADDQNQQRISTNKPGKYEHLLD